MTSHLSLNARIQEFKQLVEKIQITDAKHKTYPQELGIQKALDLLEEIRDRKGAVYFVGNGGSSALVSHILTDFINGVGLRTYTLHEPALLTCMSNDYGYENAFAKVLANQAVKEDLLIAVSSSGRSRNIHQAVREMIKIKGKVLTLSGFSSDNALRQMGDLNIWIDSCDYGLVEIGHLFILHNLADCLGHKKINGFKSRKLRKHYVKG